MPCCAAAPHDLAKRVLFDCNTCGACCCNTLRNVKNGWTSYVEVLPSDALYKQPKLRAQLTVLDEAGVYQMRLVGEEQRCTALAGELGKSTRCTIYALRPDGCRQVEPGDEECLRARRSHLRIPSLAPPSGRG